MKEYIENSRGPRTETLNRTIISLVVHGWDSMPYMGSSRFNPCQKLHPTCVQRSWMLQLKGYLHSNRSQATTKTWVWLWLLVTSCVQLCDPKWLKTTRFHAHGISGILEAFYPSFRNFPNLDQIRFKLQADASLTAEPN